MSVENYNVNRQMYSRAIYKLILPIFYHITMHKKRVEPRVGNYFFQPKGAIDEHTVSTYATEHDLPLHHPRRFLIVESLEYMYAYEPNLVFDKSCNLYRLCDNQVT